MVIYDNEFETKKNKTKPRIKLNHNIYNAVAHSLFSRNLNKKHFFFTWPEKSFCGQPVLESGKLAFTNIAPNDL